MRIPKRVAILGTAGLILATLFATTMYLVGNGRVAAKAGPSAGANVRVTVDTASTYKSADQLAGGSYTDGGATWGDSIQVTDTPTNPDYEQFGGRRVPFFGDYITVAAQGDTIGAVWTDQRNTVGAADPSGDNDGADVAGDPETGGSCTSSFNSCFDGTGGLDQNIYSTVITP